jgi:WD40 repeat protein
LHIRSGLQNTSSAEVILANEDYPASLLLVQSRTQGVRIFKFNNPESADSLTCVAIPFECHVGLCNLQIFEDLIFVPTNISKYGILSVASLRQGVCDNEVPRLMKEEAVDGMIMFLKLTKNADGEEFLIYGTESGTIRIVNIIRVISDYNGTEQVVFIRWNNEVNLNCYRKKKTVDEEMVSPLCCEVFSKVDAAYIGTTNRYMYRMKIDLATKTVSLESRKRFVNKGVNCMNLHSNGNVLATGGWDGGIRLLTVPDLNLIVYIPFHAKPINSLKFFNPMEGYDNDVSKIFMIICASEDGQVSVWNPPELYEI